jgi:MFS transporter, MCT family, solute carrier family 16 (monocarboxylic acid transporters), member 10
MVVTILISANTQVMGGIMYAPTQATIPHWFRKRLGFVLGVSAMGSSAGGTIFPIAARKLIPLVGYIFPLSEPDIILTYLA